MPVFQRALGGGASAITACDVCIVGTGPAGSTIARELSGTSLRVLLLESGGFARNPKVDLLDEVENVGSPRNEDRTVQSHRGRKVRALGVADVHRSTRSTLRNVSGFRNRAGRSALRILCRISNEATLIPCSWLEADTTMSVSGPSLEESRRGLRLIPRRYCRSSGSLAPMLFGRSLANRIGANFPLIAGATVLRSNPIESGSAAKFADFVVPDGAPAKSFCFNCRAVRRRNRKCWHIIAV
jgi:hypothetical protein